MTYELVELDAATGEEDQLLTSGTWSTCRAFRDQLLSNHADEWDTYEQGWLTLAIRPA